jgi:hypothetical protein
MVRRRPIGAVLADICRDLGVGTDHPLWRDLQGLIPIHNGQVAPIVLRTVRRIFDAHQEARQLALPPYDAPPAVAATGPPPQHRAA